MTEAAIPSRPDVAKPVRNPLKAGEVKAQEKPVRPKPDIHIERQTSLKAKPGDIITAPDGHKCVRIEYWLPDNHPYAEVLNPLYWANVAAKFMRPISTEGTFAGSIICVRPQDHSFYAELYVTEVNKNAVYVEQIFYKQFGPTKEDVKSEKFSVVWNDAVKGYDIIRKVDKAVCASARDIKRLDSAKRWLERMES